MILIQELACCHVEVEGSTAITLTQCGQRVLKRMPIRRLKHGTQGTLSPSPFLTRGYRRGDAETPFSALEEWPFWGFRSVMIQLLLRKSKAKLEI